MTNLINKYNDEYFMKVAINESLKAFKINEIPVGAIAVYKNKIIAKSYNKTEKLKTVLGHAEILLINKVSKLINDWRLNNISIYVTKKPCEMCFGAINNARIYRLIYGMEDNSLNYNSNKAKILIEGGILETECFDIFKRFFSKIRNNNL